MLELYYSPGACSLAAHIALEEAQLTYRLHRVETSKGQQLSEDYRKINPMAQVPALRLDCGAVLTQIPALLNYIARLRPDATLLPTSPVKQARADEWASLLTSALHPAFVVHFRPHRYSQDESLLPGMRRAGKAHDWKMLQHVEARLPGGTSVLPGEWSLLDGYALVFYLWGLRVDLPVTDLPKYHQLARATAQRPAVARVLKTEGLQFATDALVTPEEKRAS